MAVDMSEELIVLGGGEMGKRIENLKKQGCMESFRKPNEK